MGRNRQASIHASIHAAAHRRSFGDRALVAIGLFASAILLAGAAWLVFDVVRLGAPRLGLAFLTQQPTDAGRSGGIGSVLFSTALVLGVSLLVAVPIGTGAALWLSEVARKDGPLAGLVQASLDLLATVPSVVFGLFGMIFFSQYLQMGFSVLAGGCTLGVMILPLMIQTTWVGLRSTPMELRHAAAALSLGRIATIRHVVLPAAASSIVIGTLLSVGRALAETAALLFTSGYVTRWPDSLFDSGRTLSVHIYDLAMNVPGGAANAHATALVLIGVLIFIQIAAQWIALRWQQRAAP